MNNATFGQTIRAARLGFRAFSNLGFVRIRAGGPPWAIEVWPFELIHLPKGKGSSGGEHVVWWESQDLRQQLASLIPRLLPVPFEDPVTFWLDDEGNPVDTPGKPG